MSASTETVENTKAKPKWLRTLNVRESGLIIALIGIVILFQILTGGRLLVPDNIASLIQQNAYVMILAIGMMLVIIAGHIDLSVGSVIAFTGVFLAKVIGDFGLSPLLAFPLVLVMGCS
ncbi:MAG: sugar ABC transporter permease, partial [Dermabacter sp.]|nr:sugar ABC transporter permease [Dermabacter sp.]